MLCLALRGQALGTSTPERFVTVSAEGDFVLGCQRYLVAGWNQHAPEPASFSCNHAYCLGVERWAHKEEETAHCTPRLVQSPDDTLQAQNECMDSSASPSTFKQRKEWLSQAKRPQAPKDHASGLKACCERLRHADAGGSSWRQPRARHCCMGPLCRLA